MLAMSDDVMTAMISEMDELRQSWSQILSDDCDDNTSLPELVQYISDSDSDEDDEEVRWTSTGSGNDIILPSDDDNDDGIGILVTDIDEVGHACCSRAVADLSNDSDTESDISAEETINHEAIGQPHQDIQFNLMFHPHDIVDRDGLETTMVASNIFRVFNRSGIFARELCGFPTLGNPALSQVLSLSCHSCSASSGSFLRCSSAPSRASSRRSSPVVPSRPPSALPLYGSRLPATTVCLRTHLFLPSTSRPCPAIRQFGPAPPSRSSLVGARLRRSLCSP